MRFFCFVKKPNSFEVMGQNLALNVEYESFLKIEIMKQKTQSKTDQLFLSSLFSLVV